MGTDACISALCSHTGARRQKLKGEENEGKEERDKKGEEERGKGREEIVRKIRSLGSLGSYVLGKASRWQCERQKGGEDIGTGEPIEAITTS